jgi:hypothetical protein
MMEGYVEKFMLLPSKSFLLSWSFLSLCRRQNLVNFLTNMVGYQKTLKKRLPYLMLFFGPCIHPYTVQPQT